MAREYPVHSGRFAPDDAPIAPEMDDPRAILAAVDGAAGAVRFVTTPYAAGQTICTPADRDAILYIVRSGHVRLVAPLPDGRTIALAILGAGAVFGAFPGGEEPDEWRVRAEAMTDTLLTLVHTSALPGLIAHAPAVAAQIIRSLSAQLGELHRLIEQVLARDTSVRLITVMLKLADAFGVPGARGMTIIDFPLTHQELANMTGSNRVTVTRKLLELQKEQVIVPERRNRIAVDVRRLRALAARL